MNRYQKIAWLNLVLITLALVLMAVVMVVEFKVSGYSQYSLYCLLVMLPLNYTRFMFKKPETAGGVVCDERDGQIAEKALIIASKSFWWVNILVCLLLHFVIGPKNSVPVIAIPLVAIVGAFFMKIASSVAILVLYERGIKNV